jgi:putative phosphoesterase
MLIGVISDTHGLLRPEAVTALQGVEHIIHAGDIGDPAILDRLSEIAPLTPVRGNVDREPWTRNIPPTSVVEVAGIAIYVLHNLDELDLNPEVAGFAAVVYGHSHVPKRECRKGVLYFNPGSAGPRRFALPVSLGKLTVRAGQIEGELVRLV